MQILIKKTMQQEPDSTLDFLKSNGYMIKFA